MILAISTTVEPVAVAAAGRAQPPSLACAPQWPADLSALTAQALGACGGGPAARLDAAGIAVTTGPGRFGALRGGIAFAKGLSVARGAPLLGVPTLAAVAAAAGTDAAAAALPAGRGRWYAARTGELDAPRTAHVHDLARGLPPGAPIAAPLTEAAAAELRRAGLSVVPVGVRELLAAVIALAYRRLDTDRGPAAPGARPLYAAPATAVKPWSFPGAAVRRRADG